MKNNRKLIKKLWSKYSKGNPPFSKIEKKAKEFYLKGEGKYKLGTYVSWWTRRLGGKK